MSKAISQPYGDIFSVQTPALDQLSNRLYAQQQQMGMYKLKQLQSLDDEFKKDVTNIKSADIPEFTQAYNEYRQARIGQLQKPATNRDDYFKQQQDVNEKLANAYSILNNSVQQKALDKELATKITSNWKNYNDNASQLLRLRMNTPTSKLSTLGLKDEQGNPIDLINDESYVYKGGTDFSKNLKDAFGNYDKIGTIDETTDPKSIERTMATYKGHINSPYKAYSMLLSSLNDPRKADDFIKSVHQLGLNEPAVEDRFNQITSDPKFQHLYNLTGNESFPGDDTELGHAIKMMVMYNTTQPFREQSYKTNVENKMNAQDKISTRHIYLNATLQGRGNQNYKVSDLQLPDGNTDLTKPLQGINVNSLVTGKSFKSDKINYNPITKEVTYHDVVDDKDYTVPQSKFRQIINTINTVQDLKTYDNLIETIDKAYTKPNKKVSTKVKLNWYKQ